MKPAALSFLATAGALIVGALVSPTVDGAVACSLMSAGAFLLFIRIYGTTIR